MSKQIILFLGLLMSIQTTKDVTLVFPYTVELDDICDKLVLSEINEYMDHFTFKEFHFALKTSNQLDIENMIKKYTVHVDSLVKYVKELQIIAENDMIDDSLENSSKVYIISKLFKITMEISLIIAGKSPDDAIFNGDLAAAIRKRLWFNLSKFEYFFKNNPQEFLVETQLFTDQANNEKLSSKASEPVYFEGELCRVLDHVIPVVQFYISKQVDGETYVIDSLPVAQKKLLVDFFSTFFSYNRKALACNPGNFVKEFLTLFFKDADDLDLLLTEVDLPNIDNNKFLQNVVDEEESVSKNIHKMDKNFMDIKNKLYRLDLPTIRDYTEHPHHYSFEFIKYLNDVHDKLYDIYKGDGKDAINKEKTATLTAMRLTRLLYRLYTYARAIDVPEDQKIGKNFSKKKQPILEFLLRLIMGNTFKITENPKDENDPVLKNVNLTKQDVRNDFLALIPILNEEEPETGVLDFQKPLDEDVIPRKKTFVDNNPEKIFNVLKNFGQISNLNTLMKNHVLPVELQDNIRKNTVNVALISVGDKLNSRKPDESSENSEDIDDLVDVVIVKKRRNKPKPTSSIRPNFKQSSSESEEHIDETLVDQLVDKIETNVDQPEQEKKWRKFILKFVTKLNVKSKLGDDLWFKINTKLLNIMKQRIQPVDGFFKLFEWALSRGHSKSFFPDYHQNFHLHDHEEEILYKQQVVNEKMVSMIDNVLFCVMAKESNGQDINELPEHEKPHTTAWFQKFHNKDYNQFLNENILNGPFFYDRFHSFEFFFEIVEIFRAFDNISITTAEEKDRYGEIFLNLYRFVLDVREELNEALEDDPVEWLLFNLNDCLTASYDRNSPSKFDVDNKICNQSYKNYMEIAWFLKFYHYDRNDNHKDEDEIEFFWELPEKMFLVETSAFIIYMNKAGNTELMMNLCTFKEGGHDMQLCLEFEMFQIALETLKGTAYSFSTFNSKVFEPFEERLKKRKFILWNVLEAIHRNDRLIFNSFLVSFDKDEKAFDDQGKKHNLAIIDFLEITDDDFWFKDYMKFNFALYTVQYRALEHAVQHVYKKNQLKKYLFDLDKFSYHGHSDEHQVFHFRNIGIFLYFAHSDENYYKLAQYVQKQGWLILLFKNGEFASHDKLLADSNVIQWTDRYVENFDELDEKAQENFLENVDQNNADQLYQFLQASKPKMSVEKDVGINVRTKKSQSQNAKDRMARFKERKRGKKPNTSEVLDESAIITQMKEKIIDKVRVTRQSVNVEKVPTTENDVIDVTLMNSGRRQNSISMKWDEQILEDAFVFNVDDNEQIIEDISRIQENEVIYQEVSKLIQVDNEGSVTIPKGLNENEAIAFLSKHFKISDTEQLRENALMNQYLHKYLNSEDSLTITVQEVEEKVEVVEKII